MPTHFSFDKMLGTTSSNTHFLLHSARYNVIRQEMLTTIQQHLPHIPVTTQLLLSGDEESLSTDDNHLFSLKNTNM